MLLKYSDLLPPSWKSIYLPIWFNEDFPALDISTAIFGDFEGHGQILFKSNEGCVLAGIPFVDAVYNHFNCHVNWMFREGEWICDSQEVAIVTGSASGILKAERLALNLLAHSSTIATNAREILKNYPNTKLAGTRKTTPGFRLVEKYALMVGGIDPHRFSCTDCVMLKDNHIDLLKQQGFSLQDAIKLVKSRTSFTLKLEVECRSIYDAEVAIKSGADIVMLDNFIPSDSEILALKYLNSNVIIELSGGITTQNIGLYPENESIIMSLGALTHSPGKLLDFSFKIR